MVIQKANKILPQLGVEFMETQINWKDILYDNR